MSSKKIKKILIVGSDGYIGSNLSFELAKRGYFVTGIDKTPPAFTRGCYDSYYQLDLALDSEARYYLTNISRDQDLIIHLAALVGYPACNLDPELAWKINSEIKSYVFELNRRKPFILISAADSIYGAQTTDIVTEYSIPNPMSVYGQSKYKGELKIIEAHERAHINAVILRFSSVFGLSPKMRWDNLIHDWINEYTKGKSLTLYQPDAIRNFLSIDLAIQNIVSIICDFYEYYENYNFAGYYNCLNVNEYALRKVDVAAAIGYNSFNKNITISTAIADPEYRDYRVDSSVKTTKGYLIETNHKAEKFRKIISELKKVARLKNESSISSSYNNTNI